MVEGIPSRTKHQIKNAYKKCVKRLQQRGLTPKLQTLNNETSNYLEAYMNEQQIMYQYTPVGSHRRNIAKLAIQTFENHLVASLCSLPPNFQMNLWDKLLLQAEITLNFLQPSQINPKLSAYVQV